MGTWVSFCMSGARMQTLLHLFPAARDVHAPYEVECRIKLFAGGEIFRDVVIEGARLGQPDGFPIDGLLDGAREGALYGISVELQSVRHKVDLSSSVCITEMLRGSSSLKFRSRRVDSISPPSSMKAFHRDGSLCSCIMVNPSSDPLELDGGEILSAWSTEERTLPALPSSGVAVHPAPFLGDCVAFLLYRDDRQLLAVQQT